MTTKSRADLLDRRKAGVGKVDFMNYIWTEHTEERKRLLKHLAHDKKLIMAAVFFWDRGSELQKSLRGLLRSVGST